MYIYPMACGRTRHRAKLIQWLNDSMINDSMINDSMIQWSMIQWLNDSMINAAAGSSRQRQTTGEDGCRCRGRCRRHSWLEKYPAFVGPFLAGYFSKFNIVSLHNRTKCNRNPKPMQENKCHPGHPAAARPVPTMIFDQWTMIQWPKWPQWLNDSMINDSMIQWFNDSMIQWLNDSMIKDSIINDSMIQWSMTQWCNDQ